MTSTVSEQKYVVTLRYKKKYYFRSYNFEVTLMCLVELSSFPKLSLLTVILTLFQLLVLLLYNLLKISQPETEVGLLDRNLSEWTAPCTFHML